MTLDNRHIRLLCTWLMMAIALGATATSLTDSIATKPATPRYDALHAPTQKLRFRWGAELTGGIDMTGNDMSSLAINANLGFSAPYVNFFGVGAGANICVSNACRSYPFFAVLRTSFAPGPRLVFVDLRGGCSVNYLYNDIRQTGLFLSGGVGAYLATGKNFRSYIILAYSYFGRKDVEKFNYSHAYPSLSYANIRLGVSF